MEEAEEAEEAGGLQLMPFQGDIGGLRGDLAETLRGLAGRARDARSDAAALEHAVLKAAESSPSIVLRAEHSLPSSNAAGYVAMHMAVCAETANTALQCVVVPNAEVAPEEEGESREHAADLQEGLEDLIATRKLLGMSLARADSASKEARQATTSLHLALGDDSSAHGADLKTRAASLQSSVDAVKEGLQSVHATMTDIASRGPASELRSTLARAPKSLAGLEQDKVAAPPTASPRAAIQELEAIFSGSAGPRGCPGAAGSSGFSGSAGSAE